jgi:hypothetical protein
MQIIEELLKAVFSVQGLTTSTLTLKSFVGKSPAGTDVNMEGAEFPLYQDLPFLVYSNLF